MSESTRRNVGLVLLAVLVALGTGCNTTPKRPPPPPEPREVRVVEPPPPQTQTQQRAPDAAAPDGAAASSGDYAPPSANAAEVEIEEIALDGAPAEPAARAAAPASASGAGGAPTPDYAATGAGSDADQAGVVILNSGTAPADPDMVGPNIQLGGQTTGERVQVLDTELNNQLSAFDERMRRARQAAESERASGGGSDRGRQRRSRSAPHCRRSGARRRRCIRARERRRQYAGSERQRK